MRKNIFPAALTARGVQLLDCEPLIDKTLKWSGHCARKRGRKSNGDKNMMQISTSPSEPYT